MRRLFLLSIVLLSLICTSAQRQKAQASENLPKRRSLTNYFLQKPQIKTSQKKNAIKISGIVKNIFLGQVYPSGNLYLKAFETNSPSKWSKDIIFTALKGKQKSVKNYQAKFVKVINVGDDASFVNFPQEEKDRSHVEAFTTEDFFETFDQEPEDENVGLFNLIGKVQKPFAVFAFSKEINVVEITYMPKNFSRPLMQKEKSEVKAAKRKEKLAAKGWDCTTIPAFLDSAKQILTFKIKGTNYSGRISYYSNPGCLGHLSDIYILDILQNGALKQTFELDHYEGAI